MNTNEQQAHEHAARIEWDTDKAFEYTYALLTECNMHTEAAALKAAYDATMEDLDD
jgi:hypothetical protein